MASPLPTVPQLVLSVVAAQTADLDRVGAAVVLADELGALGDEVVTHFVEAARKAGCSWSQIGAQLGVSKQAAQQAFVAPTPRRGRFGRRSEARPRGHWSAEARAVIVGAREQSAALGHNHVGTEHLLLALGEVPGLAATALRGIGIDQEAVRRQVEGIVGRGMAGGSAHRPFTPRTKKVLELAVRETVRLHHHDLRTEHLLLALVREGDGVAAQVLVHKLGVDLPRVAQAVMELLSDGGPRTPGAPPTG